MSEKTVPVQDPCVPVPGEPSFTLLARDPQFAKLVRVWAATRREEIECGVRPAADRPQTLQAELIAGAGAEWRRDHNGAWRNEPVVTNNPPISPVVKPVVPPTVPIKVPPSLVLIALQDAIATVSKTTMILSTPLSLSTAMAIVDIESGFDPTAKSAGSTAAGLFQFTHDTWTDVVGVFGKQYGVDASQVFNASANALMGVARMSAYIQYLDQHKIAATPGNMYCLHFLGYAGGMRLMTVAGTTQHVELANNLFPVAAAANPQRFGPSVTVGQLYSRLTGEVNILAYSYWLHYPDIVQEAKFIREE